MDKDNLGKSGLATMFSVAAVWFGTHVGGGFATGNQTVQYFVKFGYTALFMPAIIIILLGWCYYNGAVMAKNHKAFRYDELAHHLYAPFSTAGKLFFDIAFFVLVVVGAGIAIAGGGKLFASLWGLNFYLGCIITGAIFFILTIFGAGLVRKASTIITLMILVCLIVLLIPGLSLGSQGLREVISTKHVEGSVFSAIWNGLLYAGFQSLVVASIISTSQLLDTTKKCRGFAIIGTIINGLMTALCAIMILGSFAALSQLDDGMSLPIFNIAKFLNRPVLLYAYSLILFSAFVSTGVGVVFGLVTRFEKVGLQSLSLEQRRIIISLVSIVLATLLSFAGLTKLIAVGYGWIGRVCVFLLVIPLAIVAPIKNAKFKKEHPEVE